MIAKRKGKSTTRRKASAANFLLPVPAAVHCCHFRDKSGLSNTSGNWFNHPCTAGINCLDRLAVRKPFAEHFLLRRVSVMRCPINENRRRSRSGSRPKRFPLSQPFREYPYRGADVHPRVGGREGGRWEIAKPNTHSNEVLWRHKILTRWGYCQSDWTCPELERIIVN